MEGVIAKVIAVFILPVYKAVVAPDDRIYWLYFLSAYLIGLAVYLNARGTWSPAAIIAAVRRLFPKAVIGHRSAIADYKMLFLNNFIYFFLFPWMIVSATYVAKVTAGAVGGVWGLEGLGWSPSWASRLALTIVWLIVWDLGFFVAHYLQHKLPVLGEFHKVHHSAAVMTPVTVFRMHPVDDILTASLVAAFTGVVKGVFDFLYADPVTFYVVNGLNVFWFLFLFAGYHLRHSHIWVMFPRPFRNVISSPALHLIHHSDAPRHYDKNFARMFIIWDQLAGTFYMPKRREEIRFGLGGGEHLEFDSLLRLYFLPFKKVAARYLTVRPEER